MIDAHVARARGHPRDHRRPSGAPTLDPAREVSALHTATGLPHLAAVMDDRKDRA